MWSVTPDEAAATLEVSTTGATLVVSSVAEACRPVELDDSASEQRTGITLRQVPEPVKTQILGEDSVQNSE